jgi:hypothetical protein
MERGGEVVRDCGWILAMKTFRALTWAAICACCWAIMAWCQAGWPGGKKLKGGSPAIFLVSDLLPSFYFYSEMTKRQIVHINLLKTFNVTGISMNIFLYVNKVLSQQNILFSVIQTPQNRQRDPILSRKLLEYHSVLKGC